MWKLVCILLLQCATSNGFLALSQPQRVSSLSLNSAQENVDQQQQLLEKASKLRQEAEAMESQLRAERGNRPVAMQNIPEPKAPAIKYTELPGSMWEITYRFADEPVKDRDEEDDEDAKPLEFYRGKLSLLLRPDGYTEILSEPSSDVGNGIKVAKIWGWDEEYSQEDGKRYLLFSMDVKTPNNPSKQRFYFQALLEQETRTSLALKDGTVTIKQDLSESKKMMRFGFFSAQGILAQFRYVGDFSAKPVKIEQE